ncbi:MAG: putative metal-binding motif-containing protein [Myxococcota bacterium]|nr:putative metal-binding motif-containing protein [Myxococcota bacterium]
MRRLLLVMFGVSVVGCGDKEDTADTPPAADDTADTTPPADDTAPADDTGEPTGDGDYDGDGSPDDEDCSDTDPAIYPGAEEIPYDGIDQDCDGYDLTDFDDDGYDAETVGGDDCNDEDPAIHPDADDVIGNKIDDDCDGEIDEGVEEVPEDFPLTLSGSGAATSRFIAVDAKGYVVLGGNFTGEIDFHPYGDYAEESAEADGDIFVTGFESGGSYRWTWVGSSDESITLHAMSADLDGNLLIAGSFSGTADFDYGPGKYQVTSEGGTDAFVARLSGSGEVLWAATMGGKGDDAAHTVSGGTAGRVYAAGQFSETVTFIDKDGAVTAAGSTDAWMMQLGASGEATWAVTLGGEKATAAGMSITSDSTENVTLAGTYSGSIALDDETSTASGEGLFLIEHGLTGEPLWSLSIPGALSIGALVTNSTDDLLLGGTLSGAADLDPGAGSTTLTATGTDGVLCWLDSSGNFTDAALYGGSDDDTIDALALDPSDRIYVAGTFGGTMTVDTHSETAAGGMDVFGMRLSSAGELDWMMRIGNGSDDGIAGIATDKDSRGWLAGSFTEALDLDPTEGNDERSAPEGSSGAWAARINSGGP